MKLLPRWFIDPWGTDNWISSDERWTTYMRIRWRIVQFVAKRLAVPIRLIHVDQRNELWSQLEKTDTEPMPNAFENHRLVQAARKRLSK
jgi:hypothetical protein